jgi:hypothetical protein
MAEINQNEELKRLLVENLAETKILREEMDKIKRYMKTRTIISIAWVVIVLLPTVLAIFYIPTIVKGLMGSTSTDLIKFLGTM